MYVCTHNNLSRPSLQAHNEGHDSTGIVPKLVDFGVRCSETDSSHFLCTISSAVLGLILMIILFSCFSFIPTYLGKLGCSSFPVKQVSVDLGKSHPSSSVLETHTHKETHTAVSVEFFEHQRNFKTHLKDNLYICAVNSIFIFEEKLSLHHWSTDRLSLKSLVLASKGNAPGI